MRALFADKCLYISFCDKIIDWVASFTIEWKNGLMKPKFQSKRGLDGAPKRTEKNKFKKEKTFESQ